MLLSVVASPARSFTSRLISTSDCSSRGLLEFAEVIVDDAEAAERCRLCRTITYFENCDRLVEVFNRFRAFTYPRVSDSYVIQGIGPADAICRSTQRQRLLIKLSAFFLHRGRCNSGQLRRRDRLRLRHRRTPSQWAVRGQQILLSDVRRGRCRCGHEIIGTCFLRLLFRGLPERDRLLEFFQGFASRFFVCL